MKINNSEIEYAKICVESICDCKVHSNNRKRENVEARVILSKILREKDIKLGRIGLYLNKHHSTIIHLLKVADDLMVTDENFKKKYIASSNLVNRGEDIDYTEEETLGYKDQITSLKCIINELNLERKYTIQVNKRFEHIIELLEINIPQGHEKIIEIHIKNMFKRISYKKK